jgi:metal-responsive CopG/Arc/MetJ family transcriptional regulator
MTVEIEIDEKLLAEVDAATVEEKTNRVDFIQKALKDALRRRTIEDKERRAIVAYRRFPIQPDEFEVEEEQLIEAWKDL